MKPLPPGLTDLAPYIHTVSPYLDRFGYWAIFFGVLLEDFGIPLPGETLLITGALFASLGELDILWVGVLGFCGAVIGDNIGYAIGRFAGRAGVLRYGRFVFLTEERLNRLEHFFTRHGGKIVVVARFIEGFRQFNGIVAGLARMPWQRFLAFNAAGAALWTGAWVSLVYFAGSRLGIIFKGIKRFENYILAALAVAAVSLAAYGIFRLVRRASKHP